MRISDTTTLGELGELLQLTGLRVPLRVIPRRAQGRPLFTVQVQTPGGGSATLSNESLGAVLDTAVALLCSCLPAPDEAVVADPDGAKVGPAPAPDGTRVGHPLDPKHCAACGHGEAPGEVYHADAPCPGCGEIGKVCPLPPHHEENHVLPEEA